MTENIIGSLPSHCRGHCATGASFVAKEKIDAFLPERSAHRFEMHQMRSAANFDVPLRRCLREGVEEPLRVIVEHQAIPLSADDGDR
jgi:hypothetical protein